MANCLHSVVAAVARVPLDIEVCISDNCSSDSTYEVIQSFACQLNSNYIRTTSILARNFINVVSLASSKYVWMIGDDDLLLPDTLTELIPLLSNNPSVDFLY